MTAPHDPSRRLFVGLAAASLTGLAAASAARAQGADALPATPVGRPEPELEVLVPGAQGARAGWAVVGLGDFAQGYVLPALARAELSRPAALVSGNRDKARGVAARYAIREDAIHDYDGMGGLRDDPSVEVVYIVTPNSTHAELTVRALEAGKHVLCEKPMANSPAECQRMIDAARAADRRLMVAYRAHFEPSNLELKRTVEAGELGVVRFASADHHRPLVPTLPRDEWRMRKSIAGGGSLVDIGIYSLNGLIWLLGEMPNRLSATTVSPPNDDRFREVESIAVAQLEFPSGARATISSGYEADKKRQDLWGSEGTAVMDPATAYAGNKLIVSTVSGATEFKPAMGSETQFTGEIDHFTDVVRNGGTLRTPAEMGLRDIHLIKAIYHAAETGRWVELEPDGRMKG